MSKEPATLQEGGADEPPSLARGASPARSQPGTRRSRHASVQGVLHDGAGTSAAMAAHGANERHVTLRVSTPEGGQVLQHPGERQERGFRGDEPPPPAHGGGGHTPQQTTGRKPFYVQPRRGRTGEQLPHAAPSRPAVGQPPVRGPYPPGGVQEEHLPAPFPQEGARPAVGQPPVHGPYPPGGARKERLAAPLPQGGAPPDGGRLPVPGEDGRRWKRFGTRKKKETRTTFLFPDPRAAHDAHPHTPGEAASPGGDSLAAPVGAAPPGGSVATQPDQGRIATAGGAAPKYGGSATAPPRGRFERVSTLQEIEEYPHPHPQQEPERYPRVTPTAGPSPGKTVRPGRPSKLLPVRKKKRRPVAICFTCCCILFWLLVVAIGVAVLVVYLLYHPQPPRLRVTTATLNAGYIDQLPPPYGGLALNSDLYVLATIYNPNTKIDVVLRYMQLDLYFHGVMIGTQVVWPPIHAEPGDTEIRNVHLVVSEVKLSQQDAEEWHNATTKNGLVEVKLAAKFHVQLNFGRWLPFRYWVYPTCSLWLDPPPGGALRRARCRKSA